MNLVIDWMEMRLAAYSGVYFEFNLKFSILSMKWNKSMKLDLSNQTLRIHKISESGNHFYRMFGDSFTDLPARHLLYHIEEFLYFLLKEFMGKTRIIHFVIFLFPGFVLFILPFSLFRPYQSILGVGVKKIFFGVHTYRPIAISL